MLCNISYCIKTISYLYTQTENPLWRNNKALIQYDTKSLKRKKQDEANKDRTCWL